MSTNNAILQFLNLLSDNANLSAFATSHFGKSWTQVKSNREIKTFPKNQYPAQIVELGKGQHNLDTEGTLGNYTRKIQLEILLSCGWFEQDPAAAFDQRTELLDLMLTAFKPYDTLNDAVAGAYITDFESDKNVHHPVHFLQFAFLVQYDLLS